VLRAALGFAVPSISEGESMKRLSVGLCVVVLAVGCGRQTETSSAEVQVHRAWQPLTWDGGTKRHLGEDCKAYGRTGCADGACVRVGIPGDATELVCTATCASEDDCPETWVCAQAGQTGANGLCVPRRGFAAHAVEKRTTRRAALPPLSAPPPDALRAAAQLDGGAP